MINKVSHDGGRIIGTVLSVSKMNLITIMRGSIAYIHTHQQCYFFFGMKPEYKKGNKIFTQFHHFTSFMNSFTLYCLKSAKRIILPSHLSEICTVFKNWKSNCILISWVLNKYVGWLVRVECGLLSVFMHFLAFN